MFSQAFFIFTDIFYQLFGFMSRLFVLLSVLSFSVSLGAHGVEGEWSVESLTHRDFCRSHTILMADGVDAAGVRFAHGKIYCNDSVLGAYKVLHDTLVLFRNQADVDSKREELRARVEQLAADASFLSLQNTDADEYRKREFKELEREVSAFAADTLLLAASSSGNTLLALYDNSYKLVKPPFDVAFYLRRKGTDESINTDNDLVGLWSHIFDAWRLTVDLMPDKTFSLKNYIGNEEKFSETGRFEGEYLVFAKNEKLRFLVARRFALLKVEDRALKLLR